MARYVASGCLSLSCLALAAAAWASEPESGPRPDTVRIVAVAAESGQSAGITPPRLRLLARHEALVRTDWAAWQVDYRLQVEGTGPLVLPASEVDARVDGHVSNSRVETHATPKRSTLSASGATGLSAVHDVLPAEDEARRCRERMIVQVWSEAEGPEPPVPLSRAGNPPPGGDELPVVRVEPGGVLHVRLLLEHQHPLYGPFEALLGTRDVELEIGPAHLSDRLTLDRPGSLPAVATIWPPEPPPEFLDTEVFLSGPGSLHLEAHVPGKQSYRFPDYRGVRYGSRMRLSFWYLVASGTEGHCQARVSQYRDLPSSWKTLHDGEVVESLSTVGRWVHVERVFRVQPEATALTFDVRILGAAVNVGELWIDEVRLEPADAAALAGP